MHDCKFDVLTTFQAVQLEVFRKLWMGFSCSF